ncbi:PA3371 family protein [Pseudomonas sp. SDO528_S397]
MTKSAWLFLALALMSGVTAVSAVSQDVQTFALIAASVFGGLFVLAALVGRRIKFDPVLR